jgi:hypothetical protein
MGAAFTFGGRRTLVGRALAMPMHDWTRVEAGIFHHFQHHWISALGDALNGALNTRVVFNQRGVLVKCYALVEQFAAGVGAPPTDIACYRQKQNVVAVRYISDDRLAAVVKIISPGEKMSRDPFRALVEKTADLLKRRIHLLIVDPFPPTSRDFAGIHGAIWKEIAEEEEYVLPRDKPLTLAAYQASPLICAYVEHFAVGDALTDMPLFLEEAAYVTAPLKATYQTALESVPRRWRRVLEQGQSSNE